MKGQLTVKLTDELEEAVTAVARKLRRQRGDVARIALERMVKEEAAASEESPYDRVKDLLGAVESGRPDLGTNYRHYLEGGLRRDA